LRCRCWLLTKTPEFVSGRFGSPGGTRNPDRVVNSRLRHSPGPICQASGPQGPQVDIAVQKKQKKRTTHTRDLAGTPGIAGGTPSVSFYTAPARSASSAACAPLPATLPARGRGRRNRPPSATGSAFTRSAGRTRQAPGAQGRARPRPWSVAAHSLETALQRTFPLPADASCPASAQPGCELLRAGAREDLTPELGPPTPKLSLRPPNSLGVALQRFGEGARGDAHKEIVSQRPTCAAEQANLNQIRAEWQHHRQHGRCVF